MRRTVGTLSWLTTLGIINNPCNAQVPIEFTMQNASTDPTDVVDFVDNDGNLVDGFDRDNDRSGLADVIEKYPDLLDSTFPGRVPVRRSVGIATVAGTRVIAQTLIFAPLDEAVGQTLVILFQDFPTVPCSAAVDRKSRTASSTARRAASGVSPELARSKGMAWAIYWFPSRQICTV